MLLPAAWFLTFGATLRNSLIGFLTPSVFPTVSPWRATGQCPITISSDTGGSKDRSGGRTRFNDVCWVSVDIHYLYLVWWLSIPSLSIIDCFHNLNLNEWDFRQRQLATVLVGFIHPKAMNQHFIMWMFCAPIFSHSEVDGRNWTGCAVAHRNKNASVQPPWTDWGMGSKNRPDQMPYFLKINNMKGLQMLSGCNAK